MDTSIKAKPKMALCVYTVDMPLSLIQDDTSMGAHPVPAVLFNLPVTLQDRATCESDDSFLQLLPYTVLTEGEGRIFSYLRGGAGEESRLHGLISIGLGGHVDGLPPAGYEPSGELEHWLKSEACRELVEEAGIKRNEWNIGFTHIILDRTNDVGRKHLGILSNVLLEDGEEIYMEPGMIEKGQWRTLNELLEPAIYDRLENWSKVVVRLLASKAALCGDLEPIADVVPV